MQLKHDGEGGKKRIQCQISLFYLCRIMYISEMEYYRKLEVQMTKLQQQIINFKERLMEELSFEDTVLFALQQKAQQDLVDGSGI